MSKKSPRDCGNITKKIGYYNKLNANKFKILEKNGQIT